LNPSQGRFFALKSKWEVFRMTDMTGLTDETLLRAYEDIRAHVMADLRSGGTYRFMGQAAKERANDLLTEIERRGITVTAIYWAD
jgi:hypothetical protein